MVDKVSKAEVAFAPYYNKQFLPKEAKKLKNGTLIFHPSLLPHHRDLDPLRWAFLFGEKYTGAWWYWASEDAYGGDICEIEVLAILDDEFPNEFYSRAVIPASMKMDFFITRDLPNGVVRRSPQNHKAATIDP